MRCIRAQRGKRGPRGARTTKKEEIKLHISNLSLCPFVERRSGGLRVETTFSPPFPFQTEGRRREQALVLRQPQLQYQGQRLQTAVQAVVLQQVVEVVSWLLLLQPSSAGFPCGFVSRTVAMVLAPHHLTLAGSLINTSVLHGKVQFLEQLKSWLSVGFWWLGHDRCCRLILLVRLFVGGDSSHNCILQRQPRKHSYLQQLQCAIRAAAWHFNFVNIGGRRSDWAEVGCGSSRIASPNPCTLLLLPKAEVFTVAIGALFSAHHAQHRAETGRGWPFFVIPIVGTPGGAAAPIRGIPNRESASDRESTTASPRASCRSSSSCIASFRVYSAIPGHAGWS